MSGLQQAQPLAGALKKQAQAPLPGSVLAVGNEPPRFKATSLDFGGLDGPDAAAGHLAHELLAGGEECVRRCGGGNYSPQAFRQRQGMRKKRRVSRSDRCFFSRLPILCDRSIPEEVHRAHACYEELLARGQREGFRPLPAGGP